MERFLQPATMEEGSSREEGTVALRVRNLVCRNHPRECDTPPPINTVSELTGGSELHEKRTLCSGPILADNLTGGFPPTHLSVDGCLLGLRLRVPTHSANRADDPVLRTGRGERAWKNVLIIAKVDMPSTMRWLW